MIQGRGASKAEGMSSVTSPGLPLRPPLILTVHPSTEHTGQEEQDSYAKGVLGCSDRRGPVSQKLGVLLDSSTTQRPQMGQKVTPGLS